MAVIKFSGKNKMLQMELTKENDNNFELQRSYKVTEEMK